jgi:hypothetical protein
MRLHVCGAEGAVAQRAQVRWRVGGGRRGSSAGGVREDDGARAPGWQTAAAARKMCGCRRRQMVRQGDERAADGTARGLMAAR